VAIACVASSGGAEFCLGVEGGSEGAAKGEAFWVGGA